MTRAPSSVRYSRLCFLVHDLSTRPPPSYLPCVCPCVASLVLVWVSLHAFHQYLFGHKYVPSDIGRVSLLVTSPSLSLTLSLFSSSVPFSLFLSPPVSLCVSFSSQLVPFVGLFPCFSSAPLPPLYHTDLEALVFVQYVFGHKSVL